MISMGTLHICGVQQVLVSISIVLLLQTVGVSLGTFMSVVLSSNGVTHVPAGGPAAQLTLATYLSAAECGELVTRAGVCPRAHARAHVRVRMCACGRGRGRGRARARGRGCAR